MTTNKFWTYQKLATLKSRLILAAIAGRQRVVLLAADGRGFASGAASGAHSTEMVPVHVEMSVMMWHVGAGDVWVERNEKNGCSYTWAL